MNHEGGSARESRAESIGSGASRDIPENASVASEQRVLRDGEHLRSDTRAPLGLAASQETF
jgi:hypothetical protein